MDFIVSVINGSLGGKDKIDSRFLLRMMEAYFMRNNLAHHPPPRPANHFPTEQKTVNWEQMSWLCRDQKHAWKKLHAEGNMSKEDLELAEKLATLWFNCHVQRFSRTGAIPTKYGLKVQQTLVQQKAKKAGTSTPSQKPVRPFEWPYRQGQWDETVPREQ